MRLPRFLLAGILLFASVFLLTGLLAQPPFRSVGVTAAGVFLPLWYGIGVVNGWLGIHTAGYPVRDEVLAFLPVFGGPAVIAGFFWWSSASLWEGGPLVHTGRTPAVLAAGVGLWAAIALLVRVFAVQSDPATGLLAAAAIFAPIWFAVCVTNLVIGVRLAGYPVIEEFPILLVNLLVPLAVAAAGWRFVAVSGKVAA